MMVTAASAGPFELAAAVAETSTRYTGGGGRCTTIEPAARRLSTNAWRWTAAFCRWSCPHRLAQFGAFALEARLVGLDEPVDLRFGDDRDLRVDLGVEQGRHRDLPLCRLGGQQPIGDQVVEALLSQGVDLFLQPRDLLPDCLLDFGGGNRLAVHFGNDSRWRRP